MAHIEDIPAFLKIPPDQRKKAWDDRRVAAKALPPEAPTLRRITSIPGEQPDVDET